MTNVTIPGWLFWLLFMVTIVAVVGVAAKVCYDRYNNFKLEYIAVGFGAGYDQALIDIVSKVTATGFVQVNIIETNQSIVLVPAQIQP